jgi:gluconokinase
MAAGSALTDEDRLPWLQAIRDVLQAYSAAGTSAVVACSALKESYRRLLLDGLPEVRIVYLRGTREVIEQRLAGREDHFFDPRLLDSQLEVLEEPSEAIAVDIEASLEEVAAAVATAVGLTVS